MSRSKAGGRPSFRPRIRPRVQSKPLAATAPAYGPNWDALSDYVRQRDGYRCKIGVIKPGWTCNVVAPPPFHHLLHAHHIVPLPRGPNHPRNLITLCRGCHGKLHGKYLGAITAKQRVYVERGPRQ